LEGNVQRHIFSQIHLNYKAIWVHRDSLHKKIMSEIIRKIFATASRIKRNEIVS